MVNSSLDIPPPLDSPFHSPNHSRDADLPAYGEPTDDSSSSRAEYTVSMDDHHGKTWWMLRISSRSQNPKSLPSYFEGDPITGVVDLNLQKPDHIKAVIIIVKGLVVYSAYYSKTFLEVSQTIWQSSFATPTAVLQPGNYCWPFSLELPSTIQLPEQEAIDYGLSFNGKLPPSLIDKEGHANINYQIVLRVKRSGFFHHDSKLSTLFSFVPATRPDPPSRLRSLSYEENLPIVGPRIDTVGWKIFPEAHLDGRLFKAIEVCLSISLALATPLAYPRGTTFPCALILVSNNKQVTHLLSAPNAPVVEVHQRLQTAVGESMVGGTVDFTEEDRLPLTMANWHPPEVEEVDGVYTSTVLGELNLPPNLVPSFTSGKFQCEYVVDVYPPEAAGFEPASSGRLFRTAITVTSLLGPGPRPRAYLPPGHLAPDSSMPGKSLG